MLRWASHRDKRLHAHPSQQLMVENQLARPGGGGGGEEEVLVLGREGYNCGRASGILEELRETQQWGGYTGYFVRTLLCIRVLFLFVLLSYGISAELTVDRSVKD